jgi:hypothetical protein
MVGFLHIVPAQAAIAPIASREMLLTPKQFAKQAVLSQWKSLRQFSCLNLMWEHESHWNPQSLNERSGAFGIPQFLPATWGNYKFPYEPASARVQITAGLRYITVRYGTPCKAWSFWQRQANRGNAWY